MTPVDASIVIPALPGRASGTRRVGKGGHPRARRSVAALAVGLTTVAAAAAADPGEVVTPAAYAPYAFLIGEWDVGPSGGKPAAVARFRWGPSRTSIWYSGALQTPGGERPSWEGPLVWNGVRKSLDFLLVLDPGSGNLVQEQGTMRAEPDGTVVREITAYYSEGNPVPPAWDTAAGPEGASARFRHTFAPDGPDRIHASVMRKDGDTWVPNFPGSDHLVMTRCRPAAGGRESESLFTGEMKPVIYVTDVEASAPFYRDVLGFGFEGFAGDEADPYYAEMTAAGIKFGLHEPTTEDQRARVGRERLYFRVRDLEAQHDRVAARGAVAGEIKHTDWMDLFIVRDAEGNEIVFAETDPGRHATNPWNTDTFPLP